MPTDLETGASLGFRVKTGKAIAVVLRGPSAQPALCRCEEMALVDPARPEVWQPYHRVMDLEWKDAEAAVQETVRAIEGVASSAMEDWIRQARAAGLTVRAAGIVSNSNIDPARIANPHIRAHAAEGRLFRRVLENAAQDNGLRWESFLQHRVAARAASELKCSEAALKKMLAKLGEGARPWRSDEKLAALAAWTVLVSSGP